MCQAGHRRRGGENWEWSQCMCQAGHRRRGGETGSGVGGSSRKNTDSAPGKAVKVRERERERKAVALWRAEGRAGRRAGLAVPLGLSVRRPPQKEHVEESGGRPEHVSLQRSDEQSGWQHGQACRRPRRRRAGGELTGRPSCASQVRRFRSGNRGLRKRDLLDIHRLIRPQPEVIPATVLDDSPQLLHGP